MQNNKDEFIKRMDEHKLIIYKICNSYCKNRHDRDDLAQEITYQLWKSYNHFNGAAKFSTWMYRVALNVAITFYRKIKTSGAHIQLGDPITDIEDSKENSGELEKNIIILQQFINELKALDKALMILYLEEKGYREISEILGITETNVATRISRIKNQLKEKFSMIKN
jgi:RNA polymerase sigma factor (sigma-70 family)